MAKFRLEVTDKEFFDKRYECAKDILSGAITHEKIDTMGDSLVQRQSLIYNCVAIADLLLEELGYTRKSNPDHATVRNLKDLLKDDKE